MNYGLLIIESPFLRCLHQLRLKALLHRPLQFQGEDKLGLGPTNLKVTAEVERVPAARFLAEPLDFGAMAAAPEEVIQEVL
jgi:hypothetical protein